jgi:hypothetical protein
VLIRIDICWSVAIGLTSVDPIRGAQYHARHLLLALRTGERRRIGRGLALETCYLATLGSQRAKRLARKTSRLAEQSDDLYLQACSNLVAASVDYYVNNAWRDALALFKEAERLYSMQGTVWELDTAQLWSCFTQIYLGELTELASLVPSYARAAERRGDRFMAVNLRTRANIIWLVADDVKGARQELDRALQDWIPPQPTFQLQHLFALYAGCDIDLYHGRPDEAADRFERVKDLLGGSMLPVIKMVELEIVVLQIRIALARAEKSSAPLKGQQRRSVSQLFKKLRRNRLPLARALASLLQAGLDNLDGDTAGAEACLRQAVQELERLETLLYANAAKLRLADLIGGEEGAALGAAAMQWMADQGIKNPPRMTAMLAPGWPGR